MSPEYRSAESHDQISVTTQDPGEATASGSSRVAAGIAVSRSFGLVRETLIAATLGGTMAADAFRAAMRVPNIIQNMLGEGVMGASFVPVYAKLVEDRNEAEARRVAGGVLGLLTAVVLAIVALIVLLAGPIVSVLASGLTSDTHDLAVRFTRITAIGIGLLGISAWALAILNSHRQFFLGYAAPALWNLAQIVVLVVAGFMLAFADSPAEANIADGIVGEGSGPSSESIALWLAVAVAVGSFLQLAVMVPRVRALTQGVTPHLRREGEVRTVLRRFVPAVGARGVVQISSLVDLQFASYLATGGFAIWSLALPLYLLPISVFGFSVATAELTEMSRQSDRVTVVAGRVRLGLRKVLLAAGLSAAGLFFAGRAAGATLYQWPNQLLGQNSFSADDNIVLGWTLAAYALALPAAMSARVTQNALFALGDVQRPARIAVIRLVVTVLVALIVVFQAERLTVVGGDISGWDQLPNLLPWEPLPLETRENPTAAHFGPVGLGIAAMIASWVEWALLRRALVERVGQSLRTGLGLPVFAAGLAAGVGAWAVQAIPGLGAPIEGVVCGVAALALYIGALRFQGLTPRLG